MEDDTRRGPARGDATQRESQTASEPAPGDGQRGIRSFASDLGRGAIWLTIGILLAVILLVVVSR